MLKLTNCLVLSQKNYNYLKHQLLTECKPTLQLKNCVNPTKNNKKVLHLQAFGNCTSEKADDVREHIYHIDNWLAAATC